MKYIVIIVSLISFFTSCADELNKTPFDKFPEDKVWKSSEGAQAFLNGTLYVTNFLIERADDWSDNTVVNSQMGNEVRMLRELLTNENDYGWNKYGDIRRCNLAIQKVTESTGIKESDKAYLIAQAKMLRAVVYYTRARMFGRLMIVDKVLTPEDNLMISRAETIKETYDFILKDLSDAAENLPLTAAAGALTKGAAYALKAEVCLQGAAYLTQKKEKDEYYLVSKQASEKLFELGIYDLDNSYDKLFNDYATGLASKEVILGNYSLKGSTNISNTWMMSVVPNQGAGKLPEEIAQVWPIQNIEGWFSKSPSQELVDAYLVVDEDGTAKKWNETSYFRNFKSGRSYVSSVIYKNRDARFYASIGYDSTMYFNSLITTRIGGNLHYLNNKEKDQHMTKTGYLYTKNVYQIFPAFFHSVPTDYHLVSLRLGRSYLNYAEALLRLGDASKAVEYINKTRTIHGNLPALPSGLSSDDIWEYYKLERRVELVQEEDRYWSLLRWGKERELKEIPELNSSPTAISIASDGRSFEIIPVPVVGPANDRRFTSKRYLLPIPRKEILLNEQLANDQNPGWE